MMWGLPASLLGSSEPEWVKGGQQERDLVD
jgi:hypothetical protein